MIHITIGYVIVIGIIASQSILIYLLLRKKNREHPPDNSPQISNEKYLDLFDNANDAIFILDKDQNYTDVNQRAVELFGYSREEFLRLNVMDVIPPLQISKSDNEFKTLREKGKYEKFVGKQRTKDGRWLDIEVNSSIIVSNNKVIGSRDIVRDITDRKKAEEEKEKLISRLQDALNEIKTLKGIIPICSYCKKIRDDEGVWNQLETYIHSHSDAKFSHGACPECYKKQMEELGKT